MQGLQKILEAKNNEKDKRVDKNYFAARYLFLYSKTFASKA